MKTNRPAIGNVLAILAQEEDRVSLHRVFTGSSWDLHSVRTLEEARALMDDCLVDVVISDCKLPDGHCWQELVRESGDLTHAPPIIVASRSVDRSLWADVLNFGGFDLLSKPFDTREVFAAVSQAWRQWMGSRVRRYREEPSQARATVTGEL
jgi:DNA-binding response OmpR family regulator